MPTAVKRATILAAALVAVLVLTALPGWGAIFSDIQGNFAQRAIERLAAKGIFRITGERFEPQGSLSRAEFAVLLTRVLGISGQPPAAGARRTCQAGGESRTGVSVAELKDARDIPQEMQSAVAAVINTGISPQKVELKKGPIVYTVTTDRAVYGPTDEVMIAFSVQNTGTETVTFDFDTDLHFDIIIRDAQGNEVAKRSLGRAVRKVTFSAPLAPGRLLEYGRIFWGQCDQNDRLLPPGRYEIVAIQLTKTNPTSVVLPFTRGLMAIFPDNTFRPRQDVSRLELATTIARSLGLAAAPEALQGITDAAEIPADERGPAGAALVRRVVLPGADRAFRPNRPATRADTAWALDLVMDTLKRYNFLRGVLKDISLRTPAQIQIEDESKALRTYRVARNHAVYRNNQAVELRDLRVGDQLQFLTVGDVGDVAYVEATAPAR